MALLENTRMSLIGTNEILSRFESLLKHSTHVDIAVAWLGFGVAVETLCEHAKNADIRIAVGLHGHATDPAAVRHLMNQPNVKLRVAPSPSGGIFHPKFYRFRGDQGASCWIGSANFTRGGFASNAELVYQFSDREGQGDAWFEELWDRLCEDPGPLLDRYEEQRVPPKPPPPVNPEVFGEGELDLGEELPKLADIDSWDGFVSAVRTLDRWCHDQPGRDSDVLGETFSCLHTIDVGGEVARRRSWEGFTVRDRNVLLGLHRFDAGGAWGALGNMHTAGRAIRAFTPPFDRQRAQVLETVLEQVQAVTDHPGQDLGQFARVARQAVHEITKLPGFGPSVTTRILTLARPELLVSVNSKSVAGLAEFSDMPADSDRLAERYDELLGTLYETAWFRTMKPKDAAELAIWRCRAALVDVFVYADFP